MDIGTLAAARAYTNKVLKSEGALKGLSAYEIAVEHGFIGTEEEWLDSLQGESAISVNKLLFFESKDNTPILTNNEPTDRIIILPITFFPSEPDQWQEILSVSANSTIGTSEIEFITGNRFTNKIWLISEIERLNIQIRVQAIDTSDNTILSSATTKLNLLSDGITPIPAFLENVHLVHRKILLSRMRIVISIMSSLYGIQVGMISNPPNEISYMSTTMAGVGIDSTIIERIDNLESAVGTSTELLHTLNTSMLNRLAGEF